MISMVQPLPVGNALRLFLKPLSGAARWRVLRKAQPTFSGVDDQSAITIYEGDEDVILDSAHLMNNIGVYYCPFYTTDGVVWTPGPVATGTPTAVYSDESTDVLSFVRDRLEAGLRVEVERGNLINDLGYIQVLNASPSTEKDLAFPLVTIHLDSEDPMVRGIGEEVGNESFDSIGFEWEENEGWLANVRLVIVGWSLNADERIELRKAIRRLVIANLSVFASKGWEQVSISQQDNDAVSGEYSAPIYQVMSTFTCMAPVVVSSRVGAIRDVIANRKEL